MSVINTNITSMIGQSNLQKSQSALQTSMERLSSGLRINSAKDDAAGQAIANRFSAQITGLNQAQRNANDGISIAQTAEGALNQVNDNLQRIRELTVQAQNGTNSESDLGSIQDEINQRLSEINRISEETDFNGTRVLASDNGLQIQVGANDGQTINVGLQQINAQTLGLNGFNVDGSGETQNEAATVTNVLAQGATGSGTVGDPYVVTTTFDAADFADDIVSSLSNGNTVAVGGGDTYTFNAADGNFTFEQDVDTSVAVEVTEQASFLTPSSGTASGTYQLANGDVASFEITSTGAITLGGQAAFISATGELTNNDAAGGNQPATIENLLTDMGGRTGATLSVGDRTYEQTAANTITFSNTASVAQVESALGAATGASTVTLGQGITSGSVTFAAGSTESDNTFVDRDGELTDIETFTTSYVVNAENGEVTVAANDAAVAGTKYEEELGATVFVSGGLLTTSETTAGDRTENPLAALDSALAQVDNLRSDLGAIQNRFESAIDNLNTNETNLSAARSRIEDADYAMEVANMTRAQILQQAGTSVLAQANQLPQNVLSLLG